MIAPRYCPSCLVSLALPTTARLAVRTRATIGPAPSIFAATTTSPFTQTQQTRHATQGTSQNAQKYKRKDLPASARRKKQRSTFLEPDLKDMLQFSLVDAMRYLRAAEVGRPPATSKYELHIRLRSPKNGAVLRNRLRLPHPVKTDLRICVICPADSAAGKAALEAGAAIVGEEEVFEAVKAGQIDFDRCLCYADSAPALQKSGVARILGPRGLMPSAKLGTVVKDTAATVREMMGGAEFRERLGTVRMAIGQLGHTPAQLADNIKAFLALLKQDIGAISDRTPKEIHEIVLSSTNGPGFSLNGDIGVGEQGDLAKALTVVG